MNTKQDDYHFDPDYGWLKANDPRLTTGEAMKMDLNDHLFEIMHDGQCQHNIASNGFTGIKPSLKAMRVLLDNKFYGQLTTAFIRSGKDPPSEELTTVDRIFSSRRVKR